MSNPAPSDWTSYQLDEVCEIVGGGTPERSKSEYWNGQIPWVSPTEITALNGRYISNTREKITDLGLAKSSAKLNPVGTVLMTSRASIGFAAINTVPVATNQGFQSFRCGEKIYNEYLYQFITWARRDLERLAAGSTFLEISSTNVKSMPVVIPKIQEQQKIAAILAAVDDVIESTQTQINKLKDLKTGMMQELLTKGIGHTEFKDSPIGRMPKEWTVTSLEDITLEHKQGYYSKDAYTPIGAYVVRITDLSNPYISFDGMPKMVMSDIDFNAYKIAKGDFLFARSGAIGRYGIFDSDNEAVFASYLIRFRFNQDVALNKFVGYCYESDYCQYQLRAITQGSSNVNINAQNIKGLLIPLPTLPEQEKIVANISCLDASLNAKIKKMVMLQSTKKALMQDLLTGKVRVNVN